MCGRLRRVDEKEKSDREELRKEEKKEMAIDIRVERKGLLFFERVQKKMRGKLEWTKQQQE